MPLPFRPGGVQYYLFITLEDSSEWHITDKYFKLLKVMMFVVRVFNASVQYVISLLLLFYVVLSISVLKWHSASCKFTLPPIPPPPPLHILCHPSHQKCAVLNVLIIIIVLLLLPFRHGGVQCWNWPACLCLHSTILEFSLPGAASGTSAFFLAVGRFCVMFFASAAIGALFGLISAVVSFALGCRSLPWVAGLCWYISVARRDGQQMKRTRWLFLVLSV